MSPLRAWIASAGSSRQRAAVRRSCQTIAGATGRPECRSQSTVVSRWFAIPIAATSAARVPAAASAAPAACPTLCQSASGSCSTQPGRGVETSTGTVARPTTSSSSPTTRQVVPVVPWSIARSMRPLSRVRGRPIGPLRTVRAWCA